MRRPPDHSRQTLIYWLVDMRPEIVAKGQTGGYPFYCGKTVATARKRLWYHFQVCPSNPGRPVCARLLLCGKEFVRIQIMEIVPAGGDWVAREKHWISILRFSFPDNCNACDGGSGSVGYIPSEQTIEKIRRINKGKIITPEMRANMSAAQKGRKFSDEHRANLKEAWRRNPDRFANRVFSDEHRAKISAGITGRILSAESRAKMSASASLRGKRKRSLFG